jgi:hypothetical protein
VNYRTNKIGVTVDMVANVKNVISYFFPRILISPKFNLIKNFKYFLNASQLQKCEICLFFC